MNALYMIFGQTVVPQIVMYLLVMYLWVSGEPSDRKGRISSDLRFSLVVFTAVFLLVLLLGDKVLIPLIGYGKFLTALCAGVTAVMLLEWCPEWYKKTYVITFICFCLITLAYAWYFSAWLAFFIGAVLGIILPCLGAILAEIIRGPYSKRN